MVRSIGMCGLTAVATAAFAPLTAGSIRRLIGRPIRICAAAQAKQVLRHPMVSRPHAVSGHPTVEANPAIRVMPVIERARRVAIDAPERGKGRIVEARAHADAEQEPRDDEQGDRRGEAEQHEARRQHQIGHRQHGPAADEIDLAADARPEQGGDHQRRREGAEYPVRGDAEIARDRVGQDGRQIMLEAQASVCVVPSARMMEN